MNSEYIIKLLNELLNTKLTDRQREVITQTIQHIKTQGVELQKFRDDITDLKIPR